LEGIASMSRPHQAAGRPPLGFVTKIVYGIGAVAYGVKDQGLVSLLMIFYNQVLGLPAATVGATLGLALILDAVADPLIGQTSDTWTSRWGRRHPFMYVSVLPVALSYLLLWNPPQSLSAAQLGLWLLVCILVVRTCITLFEIPSAAMISEFTQDYDQRTSLLSYRFFFGWIGGTAMTLLAYRVFLVPDATHPVGLLNRNGYSHYAVLAAILMMASILISAVGTHRWIPWLPKAADKQGRSAASVLSEMLGTFRHRSFLIILIVGLFTSMASGVSGALGVYIGTYFWKLTAAQLGGLILASAVGTLAALALAPLVSTKLGKKSGVTVFGLVSLASSSLPILSKQLGLLPDLIGAKILPVLYASTFIGVTSTIIASILLASMVADVVEDSELKTGRRSEGLFFSASSLVQKSVSGFGIMISGQLLRLAEFPAHADPQSLDPQILVQLIWLYLPLVMGLILAAIVALQFYKIDRETHESNLRALADIQAAGGSEAEFQPPRLGG